MKSRKQKAHRSGLQAEKIAALYLRLKGYRVLGMRCRTHQGEIDIVAYKRKTLVAVEVKARASLAECAEAISLSSQQRIARTLASIVAGHGKIACLASLPIDNMRFDAIWVVKRHLPRHLIDAWRVE